MEVSVTTGFVKTTSILSTRFGAGASQEIGAPNDDWVAEALFGFDADKQVNSRKN